MFSSGVAFGSLLLAFVVQTSAIAFWLGRMSQRMNAVEKGLEDRSGLNDKVTGLVVEQAHTSKALDKMVREMEGVHRQLANIAMGHMGRAGELP